MFSPPGPLAPRVSLDVAVNVAFVELTGIGFEGEIPLGEPAMPNPNLEAELDRILYADSSSDAESQASSSPNVQSEAVFVTGCFFALGGPRDNVAIRINPPRLGASGENQVEFDPYHFFV